MARLPGHLISDLDPTHGQPRAPARVLAVVAVLALLASALAPVSALAAEPDSEGEGQGAPPPRLADPELEPGGPETALEAVPGSAVSEEAEEDEEAPPLETEPEVEAPVPEAPVEEEAPVEAEAEAPAPVPAPEPAAASVPPAPESVPATPEYAPAASPPTYETAAPPPSSPVENEAIVAPRPSADTAHPGTERPARHDGPPPAPPAEEAPVTPAPTEPAPEPTVAPVAEAGGEGSGRIPARRPSYTVHPGDCLWSIAARLLPAGADEARIAAEVARLWRANAARIGTGDPDLILVGTVLELG